MTFPRKISLALLAIIALAIVGRIWSLELPSVRWFFSFELTETISAKWPEFAKIYRNLFGGFLLSVMFVAAVILWITGKNFEWNPMTLRRVKRFRSLKRGYRSFLLLLGLVALTLPDQCLVGRKALIVKYEDQWFFPAFVSKNYQDDTFGGDPDLGANYRSIRDRFRLENEGNFVVMPLVPWDMTFDTDELEKVELVKRDGVFYETGSNKTYEGLSTAYDPAAPDRKVREVTLRDGKFQGLTTIYNAEGDPIAKETWNAGSLVEQEADSPIDSVIAVKGLTFFALKYPPTSPSWERHHFLGTDSRGWDLFAQLYGGLQVVCKASFLYVVLTFFIGIVVGLSSGYFGGLVDLIAQRVIEILSNMPFLFIVMIIASRLGRENVSIMTIIAVLCIFSWIGISTYKRTAAFKEKARDYVAAARVLGAGTPRILFRHILPNVLSTSITLVPFSVTAVATSLTALDFIGFGLPDRYPSWGTLLADGLANLESPWIVTSVFAILVTLLLLITFVGEAIREAFDPKKFTTYQ
jgi:microcin C transport system permease protein